MCSSRSVLMPHVELFFMILYPWDLTAKPVITVVTESLKIGTQGRMAEWCLWLPPFCTLSSHRPSFLWAAVAGYSSLLSSTWELCPRPVFNNNPKFLCPTCLNHFRTVTHCSKILSMAANLQTWHPTGLPTGLSTLHLLLFASLTERTVFEWYRLQRVKSCSSSWDQISA